jgi:aspartyl-tRNA(Asn)/glutamyl-tRNA(Gln) amidotransferase subunit C
MDKAGIEKLFELTKVDVTPEELERFPREIDAILAYVAELQRADVGEAPPMLSMAPAANVLRSDEAVAADEKTRENITRQFPDSEKGFLKTKKVFGENS